MYKAGLKNNKSAFHAGYIQALRDTLDALRGHAEPAIHQLCESLARRLEALCEDDDNDDLERHTTESPRRPSSARSRPSHVSRAPSVSPNVRTGSGRCDGNTLVATATAAPNPGLRSLKGNTGSGAGSGRVPGDSGRGLRGQNSDSGIESETESDELTHAGRRRPRKRRRQRGEPEA